MIGDTLNGAGTHVAVLDGTVFDALGQLQGKYDAEFVARMITMFICMARLLRRTLDNIATPCSVKA